MARPRASGNPSSVKRRRITPTQRSDDNDPAPSPEIKRSPTPAQGHNLVQPAVEADGNRSPTQAPDTDGFATLIVGSKQHRFSIPSDILIAISHYFETALTRGFREDHSQTITWEDQSPALAERFQRWIYSYSILTSSETIEEIGWALLLDMYIFGEMYDVPSLQNTVIDAYIDKGEETEQFPASWLHKIYEITPRRCMLRKFLLDAASASRLKAWFNTEEKRAAYPREFLFDLIIKETDGKKPNRDFRDLRTDYHVRNEYTDRVRVRRRTIPEFLPDPPHGPERAAEEGEIEQDE